MLRATESRSPESRCRLDFFVHLNADAEAFEIGDLLWGEEEKRFNQVKAEIEETFSWIYDFSEDCDRVSTALNQAQLESRKLKSSEKPD